MIRLFNSGVHLNKALLTGAFLLLPITSYASFDTYCSLNWSAQMKHYDICSNLPVLVPTNDNETNMRLLLADKQLAKIDVPASTPSWTEQYGAVPFDASEFKLAISNAVPSQRQQSSKPEPYDASWISLTEERCRGNDAGTMAFINQVNKDTALKPAEKKFLITQRQAITPQCDNALTFIKMQPEWSALVRQYVSYINGTIAFYNGNYSAAQKIYGALMTVATPWIAETASYMQTRTAVENAYNTGLDEYGSASSAKIEKDVLTEAFDAITQYFKKYPKGQYSASARGLLRRLYWLGGQQRQLIDEFLWQFDHSQNPQFNLELMRVPEEINQRIFENRRFNLANFKDPFFLATYDLMYMRKSSSEKYKPLSWNALQAQQDYFRTQPELYHYLLAIHLFLVQNKPDQALNYLPKGNPPARLTYLQLSQFVLKGRILEQTSHHDDAKTLWTVLLGSASAPYQHPMVELMLALNLQHSKDFAAFFTSGSLIQDSAIRAIIIKNAADANLLESVINSKSTSTQEKQAARFVLLYKTLNYQQYPQFVDALKYLPSNAAQYQASDSAKDTFKTQPKFSVFLWKGTKINDQLSCPALSTLAQTLATKPTDEISLLCLGEFVRLSQFNWLNYNLESDYVDDDNHATDSRDLNRPLGAGMRPFKGAAFSRGEVYKKIINTSANDEIKVYALYRAINCYAPAGENDCGGEAVDKTVRQNWFNQLKQDYPDSQWTKEQKYFW
ncbi:MAG: hypothetical protein EOO69_06725 [Moraxellaceae bacterium]|nr:MAG: hypothetical protein EOO69_06725 [Moraxellaceae bacterium]